MSILSKKIALDCFQKWHDSLKLRLNADGRLWAEEVFMAGFEAARPAPSDGVIPPDFEEWAMRITVPTRYDPLLSHAFDAGTHRAERLADAAIEMATDRANDAIGDLNSFCGLMAEAAALFREYEADHRDRLIPGLIGGRNAEPWVKAERNAAIANRIEDAIENRSDLARFGTATARRQCFITQGSAEVSTRFKYA